MITTRKLLVALLMLFALAAPQVVATSNTLAGPGDQDGYAGQRFRQIEEGLEPGDEGEEVADLQSYLEHYGYLRGSYFRERYDAQTEQAVKQFQSLYWLEQTGRVDSATAELLNAARYDDRPDVAANGDPQVGEYVLYGTSWDDPNLTYAYNRYTSDLSQSAQRSALEAALAKWAAVTPLTFTQVSMSQTPDIVISFESGNHSDGNNFDGPSGVLAHAYYPPNVDPVDTSLHGDAHFDDAETWTVTIPVPGGGIDLETVAIHEFGHSLGLQHSNNTNAIMYAYYGGANRTLHSDDIAGIQQLYGSSGGGGGQTTVDAEILSFSVSPSSTTVGNAVTGTVQVRNNGDDTASIPVGVSGPANFNYSTTVSNLGSGQSTSFNFQWAPASTGNFTLTATATLSGDDNSGNNSRTSNNVSVSNASPTYDAQVSSASASPSTITINDGNVTVSAQIRNNSSTTASIPVTISGPNNWSNSTSRTLGSGSSTTVQFSWPASVAGTHTFTVSTALNGDSNGGNNSKTTNSVTVNGVVQTVDAEVVSASASPSTITQNSGNVTVSAQIRNNGTSTATIPVAISGPNNWSNSTSRTLGSGASTTVQFSWPASVNGNHTFTVSTSLNGDQDGGNNSKTTNSVNVSAPAPSTGLYVSGMDVTATPSGGGHSLRAVVSIGPNGNAASGAYVYGYWISPTNRYQVGYGYVNSSGQLTVQGSTTENGVHRFHVYNVIKSGYPYNSNQNVGNPGTVDVGGSGGGGGSTPTVDASVNNVTVNPSNIALNGGNVTITATVGNNGDNTASVPVSITGPSGYSNAKNVTIAAGSTQQVAFTWAASVAGTHTFSVTTNLSGDSTSGNNQRTSPSVSVTQASVVDAQVVTLTRSASSVEQNGQTVTFTAGVRNNGTNSANFTVRLNSGSASVNLTQQVNLAAGASQNVTFQWNPSVVGSHSFTASAELSGDSNSSNNSQSTSVTVTNPPSPPSGKQVFVDRIYTLKIGGNWYIYTWVGSTDNNVRNGATITATVRAQSGQTKQVTGTTNFGGYVLMYTGPVGSGSHTYTVDNIQISGYSFNPSLNVATSANLPN